MNGFKLFDEKSMRYDLKEKGTSRSDSIRTIGKITGISQSSNLPYVSKGIFSHSSADPTREPRGLSVLLEERRHVFFCHPTNACINRTLSFSR